MLILPARADDSSRIRRRVSVTVGKGFFSPGACPAPAAAWELTGGADVGADRQGRQGCGVGSLLSPDESISPDSGLSAANGSLPSASTLRIGLLRPLPRNFLEPSRKFRYCFNLL